jgi:flagellar FliL protein
MAEDPKHEAPDKGQAPEKPAEAGAAEEAGASAEAAAPVRGKRMILFAIIGVVALALIGGGGFFAYKKFGKKHDDLQTGKSAQPAIPLTTAHYYELDGFIVNLSAQGAQSTFLKLTVTLELPSEDGIDAVTQAMPLLRDSFQMYLRELRPDDLRGSAGLYRLREELLLRVNTLLYPVKISNILFKEILVQ